MSSTSNPQLKALAKEAAAKIKTISASREAEIKAVYTEFQAKAKALSSNSSGEES